MASLSIAPHHHGRTGTRHRPAEIGGDLAALRLATSALTVIIAVPALAVGSDRARVIGITAQLAHVLDHHVHAVRVALAQVAAAGVVRALAAKADGAVADVLTTFALLAKTI